jgi:hypothetical protein
MPKMVSEIPAGREYQFSAQPGELAVTTNRIFRIIRNTPDEFIDLPTACGISVGDPHPNPQLSLLYCTNYQAQVEGEGRMVILATFTYEIQNPFAGEDGGTGSGGSGGRLALNPQIRKADWSFSSSLMEVPVYTWRRVTDGSGAVGTVVPAANAAKDQYDGVTKVEPIVTISIQQFETLDPTRYLQHLGKTNDKTVKIGSLDCTRRTLMFRDLQFKSTSEQYGALLYRGWDVTYQFAYRRNRQVGIWYGSIFGGGAGSSGDVDAGWDMAIPESGINVIAFNPADAGTDREPYGQPLDMLDGKVKTPLALPPNVAAGDKVRGMIKVMDYQEGGASIAPCGLPIPLNDDGRPRKHTATPAVLVKQYMVTDEADFQTIFAHIRLPNNW